MTIVGYRFASNSVQDWPVYIRLEATMSTVNSVPKMRNVSKGVIATIKTN